MAVESAGRPKLVPVFLGLAPDDATLPPMLSGHDAIDLRGKTTDEREMEWARFVRTIVRSARQIP